jgi:glycogen synthase
LGTGCCVRRSQPQLLPQKLPENYPGKEELLEAVEKYEKEHSTGSAGSGSGAGATFFRLIQGKWTGMYGATITITGDHVIATKGEERFEYFFRDLEYRFGDKVKALMLYDRALSKRIYAACDIFLMPSKSEPCGLSQMIASRYGAIPVTRETGGLYDSIKGYWIDENGDIQGNGFTFANYRAYELPDRSRAAIGLWNDESARVPFIKKIMNTDFSWGVSARKYLDMYEKL